MRLVKFEPKKPERSFRLLVVLTSLKIALFGKKVAKKDYTLFEECLNGDLAEQWGQWEQSNAGALNHIAQALEQFAV